MGKLLFRADTCDLKKLVGQHGAHISAGSGLALTYPSDSSCSNAVTIVDRESRYASAKSRVAGRRDPGINKDRT